MRRILLDSIKGHEVLLKDIVSDSGIVIIAAGTIVRKNYAEKLIELGIEYIYVDDEYSQGIETNDSMELFITDQCQEDVKKIIEKHSYQEKGELEEIQGIADEIIRDIIQQPEVLYNISGVRKKSESTYSHSINVCALSVLIAIKMKLSKVKIKEIAVGSLLHDIGYTAMTFDYLNYTYNKCTELESKELKKHVVYGYTSVVTEDWLPSNAKDILLCHHERVDGSGYPFHKNGDKIKLGSKIVAVCDEFDSYVYGHLVPKMKVHDIINYIISLAGITFDFDVVNYFIESVAAYPNGTGVITNEGERGIVLRQNAKCPTRPVLRILTNAKGKPYNSWIEKDLNKELTVFIRDTIEI